MLYQQPLRNMKRNRVNPPACQRSDECRRCSFAAHCYEQLMGESNRINWPIVGFVVFVVLALVMKAVGS